MYSHLCKAEAQIGIRTDYEFRTTDYTDLTFKNRENSSKKKNLVDIDIRQTSIIRRPNEFINLSFIYKKKKKNKINISLTNNQQHFLFRIYSSLASSAYVSGNLHS